jgi:hypothetical protein
MAKSNQVSVDFFAIQDSDHTLNVTVIFQPPDPFMDRGD